MGGWVPMGGVSVRGEARPRVRDRSSRGADVCVVQAVDEDWRLGGKVLDQIKHDGGGDDSCAGKRPTGETSRQGCSSQQGTE